MDKLDSLYQLYLDNGLLTSKTSIDKFKQSNIQIQESLYNLGKEKGLFATTDLETFQAAWGEVKKKEPSIWDNAIQGTSQDTTLQSSEEPSSSDQEYLNQAVSQRESGEATPQPQEPLDLSNLSEDQKEFIKSQYYDKKGVDYTVRQNNLENKSSLEKQRDEVRGLQFEKDLEKRNIRLESGKYYQYEETDDGSFVRGEEIKDVLNQKERYISGSNDDELSNALSGLLGFGRSDDDIYPDVSESYPLSTYYKILTDEEYKDNYNEDVELNKRSRQLGSEIASIDDQLKKTDEQSVQALTDYHTDLERNIRQTTIEKNGGMDMYDNLSKDLGLNWGYVRNENIKIKIGEEEVESTYAEAMNYLIKNPENADGLSFNEGLKTGDNDIIISDFFLEEDAGKDLQGLKETQKNWDGVWGEWYDKFTEGGLNHFGGEMDAAEFPVMLATGNYDEYMSKGGPLSNALFQTAKDSQKRAYVYQYPGVMNSIRNGEISDAGIQLVGQVFGSAPQIIQMAFTNFLINKIPVGKFIPKSVIKKSKGLADKVAKRYQSIAGTSRRKSIAKWTSAGVMGAAAYGQTKNELEEFSARNVEGGLSDTAMLFNAMANGFVEVYFEKKTLDILDNMNDMFKALPKSFVKNKGEKEARKEIAESVFKQIARNANAEGMSEGFTEAANISVDILTGVKSPESVSEVVNRISDSYMAGVGMFAMMGGAGVTKVALQTAYNSVNSTKINESFKYTITDSVTGNVVEVDRNGVLSFLSNNDNIKKLISKDITIDASMDPEMQEQLYNIDNGLMSKAGQKAQTKFNKLQGKFDESINKLNSITSKDVELDSTDFLDTLKEVQASMNDLNNHVGSNPFLSKFDNSKKRMNQMKKALKSKGIRVKDFKFTEGFDGLGFRYENGEIIIQSPNKFKNTQPKVKVFRSFDLDAINVTPDVRSLLKNMMRAFDATRSQGNPMNSLVPPTKEEINRFWGTDDYTGNKYLYLPIGQSVPSILKGNQVIEPGVVNVAQLSYEQALSLLEKFNAENNSNPKAKQGDINIINNNKVLNNLDESEVDQVTNEELNADGGYYVLGVGNKKTDADTEAKQVKNLISRLQSIGANFKKVVSVQDGVRKSSFIVTGISKDQALKLTRDFSQKYTYSSKNGILFSDGTTQNAKRVRGVKSLKEGGVIAIKNSKGEIKYIGIRPDGNKSHVQEYNKSNIADLAKDIKDFSPTMQKIMGTLVSILNSVNGNIPFVIARTQQNLYNHLTENNINLGKGVTAKMVADKSAAFYAPDGKVYINAANLTLSDMFHDIVHPLVASLKKNKKGKKVYKKIEDTVRKSNIKKRYQDQTTGRYSTKSYLEWAKDTYQEVFESQGLTKKQAEEAAIEEAFAEMLGDAAAAKFSNDLSTLGQIRKILKEFLSMLFGEDRVKSLMTKLGREGKTLDLLTIGDMSDTQIRKSFSRNIVSGESITIGDKDIDFGFTNEETKLSISMNKSMRGLAENGDEILTSEVDLDETVSPSRFSTKFSLRQRKGFKESDVPVGSIIDLNGQKVMVSAIDMSAAGQITSSTGITHMMMGGILYPMLEGTEGWAFTTREKAQTELNKLRKNGTNTMVFMVQAPQGILGNLNFIEYMEKELQNGLDKKKIGKRKLTARLNQIVELNSVVKSFQDTGVSLPEKKFKSLSDFSSYLRTIGTGSRNIIMDKLINEGLLKELGLPNSDTKVTRRKKELLEFVNESMISDAKKGDLVGAIEIDLDSEIVETKPGDVGHHVGYPFAIKGANFRIFDTFTNITNVFPNYASMSEIARAKKEGRRPVLLSEKSESSAYATFMYGGYAVPEVKDDFSGGKLQYGRFSLSNRAKFNGIEPKGTKGFKDWFGKSNAVDSDGDPRVFYHGTKFEFETFEDRTDKAKGVFFTANSDFANLFAGNSYGNHAEINEMTSGHNVIPVYLKTEKTWDYEDTEHISLIAKAHAEYLIDEGFDIDSQETQDVLNDFVDKIQDSDNYGNIENYTHYIKELGFDSYFVEESFNESTYKNIAVFDPEAQVRSVYKNNYNQDEIDDQGRVKFSLKLTPSINFKSPLDESLHLVLKGLGQNYQKDFMEGKSDMYEIPKKSNNVKTPKKWIDIILKSNVPGIGDNVSGINLLEELEEHLKERIKEGTRDNNGLTFQDIKYLLTMLERPEVNVNYLYGDEGVSYKQKERRVLDAFEINDINILNDKSSVYDFDSFYFKEIKKDEFGENRLFSRLKSLLSKEDYNNIVEELSVNRSLTSPSLVYFSSFNDGRSFPFEVDLFDAIYQHTIDSFNASKISSLQVESLRYGDLAEVIAEFVQIRRGINDESTQEGIQELLTSVGFDDILIDRAIFNNLGFEIMKSDFYRQSPSKKLIIKLKDVVELYFPQAEYEDYNMSRSDIDQGPNYREIVLTHPNPINTSNLYASQGHFPKYKPVLGWARIDDRTDSDGNKIMFIREVQSDWQQRINKEERRQFEYKIDEWKSRNGIKNLNDFIGPKTKAPKRSDVNATNRLSERGEARLSAKIDAKIDEQKNIKREIELIGDVLSSSNQTVKEYKSNLKIRTALRQKNRDIENDIRDMKMQLNRGTMGNITYMPWGTVAKSNGLIMRTLLNIAAKEGYDYITFPSGEIVRSIQGWSQDSNSAIIYEETLPSIGMSQIDKVSNQSTKSNKDNLTELTNDGMVLASNLKVNPKAPRKSFKLKKGSKLTADEIRAIQSDDSIQNVNMKQGLVDINLTNLYSEKDDVGSFEPIHAGINYIDLDMISSYFNDMLEDLSLVNIEKQEDIDFIDSELRDKIRSYERLIQKEQELLVEEGEVSSSELSSLNDSLFIVESAYQGDNLGYKILAVADFAREKYIKRLKEEEEFYNRLNSTFKQSFKESEWGSANSSMWSFYLKAQSITSSDTIILSYLNDWTKNNININLFVDNNSDFFDSYTKRRVGVQDYFGINKINNRADRDSVKKSQFIKDNFELIETAKEEGKPLKSIPVRPFADNINKSGGVSKFSLSKNDKVVMSPNQAKALNNSYFELSDFYDYFDVKDGVLNIFGYNQSGVGIINPTVEPVSGYAETKMKTWARPRLHFNLNENDDDRIITEGEKNKGMFPMDRLYPLDLDPLDIKSMVEHNISKFKEQGNRFVSTLNFNTDNPQYLNISIDKIKSAIDDSDLGDDVNIMAVIQNDDGLSVQLNYGINPEQVQEILDDNCDEIETEEVSAEDIQYNEQEETAKVAESAGFQGFIYDQDGEGMVEIWEPVQSNPTTRFSLVNNKEKTMYVSDSMGFLFDLKTSLINQDYKLGKFLSGLRYFGSRIKLDSDKKGLTKSEIDKGSKLYDSTRRYDIRASKILFKPAGQHTNMDIKNLMIYAKGSANRELFIANSNAKKLQQVIKEITSEIKETDAYKNADKAKQKQLIADVVGHDKIQLLLTNKSARKVEGNPKLLNVINEMVNHVTSLSTILLDEGLVSGPLALTIDANKGIYLHRKYKLYGSKSYSPTEEVREKAILFMVSELQGKKKYEGKPVEELYDVAKKKIDTILRKESGSLDYFGGGFANALTSDVSIFKARNTNLPKEIRDLLGEVVDPFNNYLTTVSKISNNIASERMYEELLDIGLGDFIMPPMDEDANLPQGESSKFSGNKLKGSKWGALEGYFVDNEMYNVLNEFDESVLSAANSDLMRKYLQVSLLGKKFKTIWSLGTHFRNVIGNTSFVLMNGHVATNGVMFKDAINMIKFIAYDNSNPQLQELYEAAITLGVVNTNAFLQEINSIANQLDGAGYDINEYIRKNEDATGIEKAKDLIKGGVKGTDKFLTKAYQVEDDVFKFLAFATEINRYKEAGFPEDLARRQAAINVRGTYPNYDEVPAFIRSIGRFPLVGTFVSFQAETWRCSLNALRLANEEMNSNNPKLKSLGSKRMASALAGLVITESVQTALIMGGYGLSQAIMSAFRDDEEEEEFDMSLKERSDFEMDQHIERIIAEWDRNSKNTVLSRGTMIDMDPKSPFYRQEVPYIEYINMSKMSGTGFIRDTFRVMMKGFESEEGLESFTRVVKQIYEPFLSIDMTTSAIKEVIENRNNRIYNESDDPLTKMFKGVMYVAQVIGPSTINQAAKLAEIAATTDTNRSVDTEMLAMLGLRITKLMPYTSSKFDYTSTYRKMKELSQGEEGLIDKISTPFKNRVKFSLSSESDTKKRYRDPDNNLFDSDFEREFRDMVKITKGVRKAGGRGVDIINIMTGSNVKMPKWLAYEILNTADYELAN